MKAILRASSKSSIGNLSQERRCSTPNHGFQGVVVADTMIEDPDDPNVAIGKAEDELSAVSMIKRLWKTPSGMVCHRSSDMWRLDFLLKVQFRNRRLKSRRNCPFDRNRILER